MRKTILIILFVLICMSSVSSGDTVKMTGGLYKIRIRTGSMTLFKGEKECYLIIDEQNKSIKFGGVRKSSYHIEATFIKDIKKGGCEVIEK